MQVLPVVAGDDPAMLADCDVILLSSKTTGLEYLCARLAPHIGADTVLLTLQNGVEAPALVSRLFPSHAVLAGSAFIGVRVERPGFVVHSAAGHLRLGAWQGEAWSQQARLLAAWQAVGVDARAVDDMHHMLWNKMLWNCGFNAITALTRRYARDVAAEARGVRWVRDAMHEVRQVAAAEGVELKPEEAERHITMTLQAGPVKTSMWQDFEHGHATEIDTMNGCIVRLAEQHGLAVPVNAMLADLIRLAEKPAAS
jgi:2-dehydropantoate 2-reductase